MTNKAKNLPNEKPQHLTLHDPRIQVENHSFIHMIDRSVHQSEKTLYCCFTITTMMVKTPKPTI